MRHTLTRFVLVGVAAVGTAAAAPAFYWVGWPGANPVAPPSIVPQIVVERPEPPPKEPPPEEPPPPVPEPATLAVAAVGMGVLGVRWWAKRKK